MDGIACRVKVQWFVYLECVWKSMDGKRVISVMCLAHWLAKLSYNCNCGFSWNIYIHWNVYLAALYKLSCSWFSKFGNCYPFTFCWVPLACLHCSPLVLTIHKTKHNIWSKLKYIFFSLWASLCALSCQLWHKIVIFINFCHF